MGIILQVEPNTATRKLPTHAAAAGVHLIAVKDYPEPFIFCKGPLELVQIPDHLGGGVTIDQFPLLAQGKVIENGNCDIVVGVAQFKESGLGIEFADRYFVPLAQVVGNVSQGSNRVGL